MEQNTKEQNVRNYCDEGFKHITVNLQETDKKHEADITDLKKLFRKQQQKLIRQQKILSISTALSIGMLLLYANTNNSNINPEVKATLNQVIIVILTGAGGAAAMTFNSSNTNPDDED